MPRHRSARVLDGRVAVIAGEFDDGPRGRAQAQALLLAHGASLRDRLDDACSLLVLGGASCRLAALLGPTAEERDGLLREARGQRIERVDARELNAWLARAPAPPPAPDRAPAWDPGARVAAARGNGPDALEAARALLTDPRLDDPALRAVLCARVERRADGDAIGALADVLRARAPCAELAAASLGRLVARGFTRWNTATAPLAIELAASTRPRAAVDRALVLARALGAAETLRDERGRAWLRALPASSRGAIARPELFELMALARARRGSVWVGGVALPAALDATTFRALFAPLDARAGRAGR